MKLSLGERVVYGLVCCTLLGGFLALLATLGFVIDPARSLYSSRSVSDLFGAKVGVFAAA